MALRNIHTFIYIIQKFFCTILYSMVFGHVYKYSYVGCNWVGQGRMGSAMMKKVSGESVLLLSAGAVMWEYSSLSTADESLSVLMIGFLWGCMCLLFMYLTFAVYKMNAYMSTLFYQFYYCVFRQQWSPMQGAAKKVWGAGGSAEEEGGGEHRVAQGPGAEERHDLCTGKHHQGEGEEVPGGA